MSSDYDRRLEIRMPSDTYKADLRKHVEQMFNSCRRPEMNLSAWVLEAIEEKRKSEGLDIHKKHENMTGKY